MMKKIIASLILCIHCMYTYAGNLSGMIFNESHQPLETVYVTISLSGDNDIMATSVTTANGSFIVRGLNAGTYTLTCSRLGYQDYRAEIQITENKDMNLGKLVMHQSSIEIDEISVVANRNVFTTDKQSIYPTKLQVEQSMGGLELLKKLPIPLLDIHPITRTISSLDPTGGVAIFVNDIPSNANDMAILNPKRIKKVEVIRNPGMKYGANLAMAINIVLHHAEDGVSLGMNTTNSTQTIYGFNNIYGTYVHKNSQLTLNLSENYQNYARMTYDEMRKYLLPNGNWQTIHWQNLSARQLSLNHGTTCTYNFTIPDKLVVQLQGYAHIQRNPKNKQSALISENNKSDYQNQTDINDQSLSPALSLYLKRYLPTNQTLMLNLVGTYIHSDYNYYYSQKENGFQTKYKVEGSKISAIGELRYSKNFTWGSFASGLRSFYGHTNNRYQGSTLSQPSMQNLNSNIYTQIEGRWRQLSGRATLSLTDQYYTQQNEKYHKLTISPELSLNYSPHSHFSLGYGFSLSSRLPSLASLNGATIQLDAWERRVGNPLLKPFNHIENSLSATYYTAKLFGMIQTVFASNKHAIMPSIIRTQHAGYVFFDNTVNNEREMNQLVLTAYVRYAALKQKLVFNATGSYNYFTAKSHLYTNKRGFFFGDVSLESYLGKFYVSAALRSRYNSLFAETVWYNEYTHTLSATYKHKRFSVGLTWEQPLQHSGTNSRIETKTDHVYKLVRKSNPEAGNHFLLTFSWRWDYGFKAQSQRADVDNKDTDSGILK